MAHSIEYTLHVPRCYNSGARVDSGFFATLESKLASVSGGYNRARTIGAYRMSDGSVKREHVYVYTVIGTRAHGAALRAVAEFVKRQLAQESVLITARTIDASFV